MGMTTFSGTVTAAVSFTGTKTFTENTTPVQPVADSLSVSISLGTGAGQSNNMWTDQRGLGGNAADSLNLGAGGGGTDLYPMYSSSTAVTAAITFTTIHTIFIRNLSSVADISVGGVGATDLTALLKANGDGINIRPGGCLLVSCGTTDATQYVVAAAEVLYIYNNHASATATYSITIIGVTA